MVKPSVPLERKRSCHSRRASTKTRGDLVKYQRTSGPATGIGASKDEALTPRRGARRRSSPEQLHESLRVNQTD